MYILGIDVGTTGTKALVVSDKGKVIGSGYKGYDLHSDGVRVTQNAADWWNAAVYAVRTACKDIDTSMIGGISMSTQAASMLCVDKSGEPISEVITWMDSRSAKESEALSNAIGSEEIYKISGWLPNPVLDAAKIMWLKEHEPCLFYATDKFITTLEFMNMKLCGRCVIDPTNAAMRQIFDIRTKSWSKPVLDYIGITEEKLPEILPIGALVGNLTEGAAAELGLSTDVKVFNGAHDQYFASVGCGAVNPGDMLLATGTTWVVLGVTDNLLYTDNHISPGIHPVDGNYGALASLVSAGSALKWYNDIIDGDLRTVDSEAAKRREEAKNLFTLPYVCGAGFPHLRPDMRGVMIGLDVGHDKYHLALSLMEGVAFEAAGVLDGFKEHGMSISKLYMTGGAARSDLWSSIVGYATGCEIYRMQEKETCCIGAAMTAAVGLGIFPDYTACRDVMVKMEKLEMSDSEAYKFYKEKKAKYFELVDKMKKII